MLADKRTLCSVVYSTLFILIPILPLIAQNGSGSDTTMDQNNRVDAILNQMQQEMQTPESQSLPDSIITPPTAAQLQLFDDSTLAIYQDALYAYYEYRVSGFQHRKEVFAWQLFSTKLIFWSVLFLVFSGICFSGIQFYKSISRKWPEGTATPESVTEFEASAQGIKISSPVLGVIILVISLAFFYLYLVHVYPISEIF
ncbi:hypothetical protein BH23BAC3_BH23BAC3_07660 [soil metagenome]